MSSQIYKQIVCQLLIGFITLHVAIQNKQSFLEIEEEDHPGLYTVKTSLIDGSEGVHAFQYFWKGGQSFYVGFYGNGSGQIQLTEGCMSYDVQSIAIDSDGVNVSTLSNTKNVKVGPLTGLRYESVAITDSHISFRLIKEDDLGLELVKVNIEALRNTTEGHFERVSRKEIMASEFGSENAVEVHISQSNSENVVYEVNAKTFCQDLNLSSRHHLFRATLIPQTPTTTTGTPRESFTTTESANEGTTDEPDVKSAGLVGSRGETPLDELPAWAIIALLTQLLIIIILICITVAALYQYNKHVILKRKPRESDHALNRTLDHTPTYANKSFNSVLSTSVATPSDLDATADILPVVSSTPVSQKDVYGGIPNGRFKTERPRSNVYVGSAASYGPANGLYNTPKSAGSQPLEMNGLSKNKPITPKIVIDQAF